MNILAQKGFSTLAVVIVATLAVIIGGVYILGRNDLPATNTKDLSTEDRASETPSMANENESVTGQNVDKMMGDKTTGAGSPADETGMKTGTDIPEVSTEGMMMKNEKPQDAMWRGAVLAGTNAPLLEFNKEDYDSAIKSGRLIVLYYYANWCPLCRAEFPKMQAAFDSLSQNNVVGFRVNYKDNETTSEEVALAKEHGVAYQHTKVFVRHGERIGKYPDTWDSGRYQTEIQKALSQ